MNGSGLVFSLKAALLSTVALSTAVVVKLMVPPLLHFAYCRVPEIYSSALSWLTPPYLYFVVNCIIITIAATSRFQGPGSDQAQGELIKTTQQPEALAETQFDLVAEEDRRVKVEPPEERRMVKPFGRMVVEEVRKEEKEKEEEEEEEEFVISRSNWTPPSWRRTGELSSDEKPPVSSRFGSRKSVRPSPEAKVLGVSRPKRNETLESTWKMLTEGRAPPLARHLKKSDTWETTQGRARREQSPAKKSETLDERRKAAAAGGVSPSPGSSGGSGRLRRESSMSHDELNRRVEAFIKKFNEQMRLQRQESIKNIVARGS